MQNYAPGGAIQVTFDLRNEAGDVLIPTALRWRVLDEAETVLQDWTALTVQSGDTQVSVSIIGALNILTPPALRGIRTVELDVETASGFISKSESVMIQALSQLSMGSNTFLTYAQALMIAQDFSPATLGGWWSNTGREERERALTEAHSSILRMPVIVDNRAKLWTAGMEITDLAGSPVSNRIWSVGVYPDDTRLMPGMRQRWLSHVTAAELESAVPERQMTAIRKAQLLEASAIMENNPVMNARRSGLMSMTVGESSQFFRTSKPLDTPVVSPQALEYLKPYIRYVTKIGRG